jgi:propionyl-CoA synthetase
MKEKAMLQLPKALMKAEDVFGKSLEDPESFWEKAAEDVAWYKRWERILDDSQPPFYRWFPGGELNTCYNALDVHIEKGRGGEMALIYDSPVTDNIQRYTYSTLRDRVSRIAGILKSLDVSKGDTVVIYMPMIPEAIMAMLACARLGIIHSVVFGGFAPRELSIRIDDAKPKVIMSASCGIEGNKIIPYKPLLDEAINRAFHKPEKAIIFQRPQVKANLQSDRDLDWAELEASANSAHNVPVKSNDPLYILYTSGTTGVPKGVVRDNGGHAVALKWSMKNIYGINSDETFWAASDVGWVVGHSYIVYAPLLIGATTIIYEGKPVGTPDPGAFWRVISEHKVKVFFTAPTAFRAIKREDPYGVHFKRYDTSCLDAIFLAGERTDPDTYHWASRLIQKPVIDHWWQTETGWAITANFRGLEMFPIKPGSAGKPVPGYNVKILNPETGHEVSANQNGVVAIKLPLPPGTVPSLWKNDAKFQESYTDIYPGYYFTGDGGYIDEDGYVYIMGRVDDVINVAGHRLSSGDMEEVIAEHPDVAECAVIGVGDDLKGQVPLGIVTLKSGVRRNHDEIISELVEMVRKQVGAVACFKISVVVDRLPKTRSGKILRSTMRKIADGEEYAVPPTIDDPVALKEIEQVFGKIGYGKKQDG